MSNPSDAVIQNLRSEYRQVVVDIIIAVADSINNKLVSKILRLVSVLINSQSKVVIAGYEMQDLSINMSVIPSLTFALVKK